jgi:lipoprotein NlpI
VNPDDVENAAWHFLCAAREQGVEKARAQLIPIEGDTRVPMKQIHELFAGKLTRKEVLAAADAGADAGPVKLQRFYAHLYLALYAEALGQIEQRDEDLRMAVLLADPEGYMGIVARVHADQVAARAAKPAKPATTPPVT